MPPSPPFPTKRMLGIDFFIGTAAEAIAHLSKHGGLVVAPAAPSFIALQDDPDYRRAIAEADLAIADSGWAVLFWRLLRREKLTRISGLALFKVLLDTADARIPGNLFWILPSERAKTKALEFARASGYPIIADDCYVAPTYQRSASGPEGPTPRREVREEDIYTRENDPRILPVGRWLRKLRLDELPQLWNVLNGELSLIGPRAEWIECAERYEKKIPFYHFRHLVKPGITGWAQVNYPYGESEEDAVEKLKYDLYYIRHYSLKLDAMIVLKTIHIMFAGKGR